MMRKNGLTLIEILIVIIIMAILATMILPKFFGQEERGYVAEAVGILSAMRQGEEAYKLEYSGYKYPTSTADWALLGMDSPTGVFTYTVTQVGTTTSFIARAARNAGGSCAAGLTITLSSSGTYGGTHILGPNPDPGASC